MGAVIIWTPLVERHPEVPAIFGGPRRMVFSAVLAAILRGSQGLAPQDDVREYDDVRESAQALNSASPMIDKPTRRAVYHAL
jgi:hypothetical protein